MKCQKPIPLDALFTLGKSYTAICRTCQPFEVDPNSIRRVLKPTVDSQGHRDRYGAVHKAAASECDCGNKKGVHYDYCAMCDAEIEARKRLREAEIAALRARDAGKLLRDMQANGNLRSQRLQNRTNPAIPLDRYAPLEEPPERPRRPI